MNDDTENEKEPSIEDTKVDINDEIVSITSIISSYLDGVKKLGNSVRNSLMLDDEKASYFKQLFLASEKFCYRSYVIYFLATKLADKLKVF